MRAARGMILTNRDYFDGISQVFRQVEFSYQKEVEKQRLYRLSQKNGRTAHVLISANTGFYGPLIEKTFNLFASNCQGELGHPIIIGHYGKALAEHRKLAVFTYFDFPDQNIDGDALRKMVEFLMSYSRVIVYHGLFLNVLTQEPTASDVSGQAPVSSQEEGIVSARWLFEPDLPKVLTFFETEIFSALFAHALNEAMLSKFASRMASLDQASESVKRAEKLLILKKRRLEHQDRNKRQQAAMSSMRAWRGKN